MDDVPFVVAKASVATPLTVLVAARYSGKTTALGPMAEAVKNSTSHVSDADLALDSMCDRGSRENCRAQAAVSRPGSSPIDGTGASVALRVSQPPLCKVRKDQGAIQLVTTMA